MFMLKSTHELKMLAKDAEVAALSLELYFAKQTIEECKQQLREANHGNGQFDENELRLLARLCHPDKHQGRSYATELFQKIQKLRGQK